jgi:disulfide bond formation protein DsbB
MLAGVLLGRIVRAGRLRPIGKVIIGLVWLLLFLLGIDVVGNRSIVSGLHTIGAEAAIITAGAVTGSTLFAWALWRFISAGGRAQKNSRPER